MRTNLALVHGDAPGMASFYAGLLLRGVLVGAVSVLGLLLPQSGPVDHLALVVAVALFAYLLFVFVAGLRAAQRTGTFSLRFLVLQNALAVAAATAAGIAGGGIEGTQRFLLLLIVVITAAYRIPLVTIIGWINANVGLAVSALAVGLGPGPTLTLTVMFAAASAGVASLMDYFARRLAESTDESADLAAMAGIAARSSELSAGVTEATPAIRRVTSASKVELARWKPDLPNPDDRYLFLGSDRHGAVHLCVRGLERIRPVQLGAVADIFRPLAERDLQLASLETESRTDPLTGLANRRVLDETLAAPTATAVTIALIDLDHFKAFNDRYGHLMGDDLLRRFAAVAAAVAAPALVIRFGGEEFCAVLGCSAEEAMRWHDRLQHEWRGQKTGVSFSSGLATRRPDESATDLLARADAALYEAKQQGRDQYRLAA